MIGWVCSIVVLKRIKATGQRRFGVFILNAQLVTLMLANAWNIYEIISPAANTTVYFILDLFWPISQVVLLAIGVTTVIVRTIEGKARFIPLIAGMWFVPVSILLMVVVGQNYLTMIISGIYSAVAWLMLGWFCYSIGQRENLLVPARA